MSGYDPFGPVVVDEFMVVVWSAYARRWTLYGAYAKLPTARAQRTKLRAKGRKACHIVRATSFEEVS